MQTRTLAAWIFVVVVAGLATYAYWQGTPQDIVNAVRSGDLAAVSAGLARDPSLVHTKVYPQGYERVSVQRDYEARTGGSAWQGRYLIHDAAARVDAPVPMLEALAAAGADLDVRLQGRSLLHLAAAAGNVEVASWLVDRGADVNAGNDCANACAELGRRPLHDAVANAYREAIELLLVRGADPDALSASGERPLHAAAAAGFVDDAWLLCRYGADPSQRDAQGRTPADIARSGEGIAVPGFRRAEEYGAGAMADWLTVGGGCEALAARARSEGVPVDEDEARVLFGDFLRARDVPG